CFFLFFLLFVGVCFCCFFVFFCVFFGLCFVCLVGLGWGMVMWGWGSTGGWRWGGGGWGGRGGGCGGGRGGGWGPGGGRGACTADAPRGAGRRRPERARPPRSTT
ncbi:hypothetical protein PUR61_03100, partial [Streptomyces sp. BE20]|nr:hypothetical protein [Streptomyces sp. BE20]